MNRARLRIFSLLLFGSTSPSIARIYNYQDVGLGERAAGMGQVSMALAGDVGSAYFNPAVLSWSNGVQMAASVSAYERVDSRTGKFVSVFESALDNVKRGGFVSIPSMIGGHLQRGDWTWGGAVLVPTSFSSAGTQDDGEKFFSYEGNNQDVWLNAFGAFRYNEKNRFGISLFYVSKELREKFTTAVRSGGNVDARFEERFWSVNGMSVVIGGVHVLSDQWTVGWSLRPGVWKWGGSGQMSVLETGDDTGLGADFTPKFFPLPSRISAGVSYRFNDAFLMAFDLHLYPGYGGNLSPDGQAEFKIDANPIANFGLGAEYFYSKGLGFRLGFNSNLSASRRLPPGMSAVVDKIHMGTGSGAIVLRTENGDMSIGGWASGGQGWTRRFDPSQAVKTPRSLYIYGAVIGSTYRF
jgi:hypothetical protein